MTAAPDKTKKYSTWKGEYDSLLEIFKSSVYTDQCWLRNRLKELLSQKEDDSILTPQQELMLNEYVSTFEWDVEYEIKKTVEVSATDMFTVTVECDSLEEAIVKSNESVDHYDSDEIEELVSYPVWEVDDVDVEVVVVHESSTEMTPQGINRLVVSYLRSIANKGSLRFRKTAGHKTVIASYAGKERCFHLLLYSWKQLPTQRQIDPQEV